MSEAVEAHDYPGRDKLIGDMLGLLKAARRPVRSGEDFRLDRDGRRQADLLANTLVRHLHFEHLGREQIRDALLRGALLYRNTKPTERPPNRQVAAEILDAMARPPMHRTVYLGVEHLKLPHGTVVGEVRFIDPHREPDLMAAFAWLRDSAPQLLCEVQVTAGTDELLRERARDKAETALGLVRQHNLFGFMSKIYLDQIVYGLNGTWTYRDGSTVARAGWWREKPRPTPMDLDHPNGSEWREQLAELSDLYRDLTPALRQRVDTCIDWLNVAALSDRWRIIIPAVFSGIEALLVPESFGLKAEVVTVRSVAVHVALQHEFFNPSEIMAAYRVRSDLIHGNPTREFIEKDVSDFADFRRYWAFGVLRDYLGLAKAIDAKTIADIVSYLDHGKCHDVCIWLEENGGSGVVAEYRRVVPVEPASDDAH